MKLSRVTPLKLVHRANDFFLKMLLFNEGFVFSVPTSQNAKDNN